MQTSTHTHTHIQVDTYKRVNNQQLANLIFQKIHAIFLAYR